MLFELSKNWTILDRQIVIESICIKLDERAGREDTLNPSEMTQIAMIIRHCIELSPEELEKWRPRIMEELEGVNLSEVARAINAGALGNYLVKTT